MDKWRSKPHNGLNGKEKAPEAESPPSPHSFRRVIRTVSLTSLNRRSSHRVSNILPPTAEGERCLATLQVQVLGCQNLPAADLNGKSDPYVVVNFARQRFKTRPIKRTLNPKYPAQDATFDFPIYLSAIEQVGPLIEFTVWDKDFIGKSYLAEISLAPEQWFKRRGNNGSPPTFLFDDKDNDPASFPLTSMKHRSKGKSKDVGTIQLKIGFQRYSNDTDLDLGAVFTEIIETASKSSRGFFSTQPSHGMGAVKETYSPDGEAKSLAPTSSSSHQQLRINWEGTKVDYNMSSGNDVLGILMLEVKGAEGLPKPKDAKSDDWTMDPFVAINFGSDIYRTRIIRHDLNPAWGDKFILQVRNDTSLPGSRTSQYGSLRSVSSATSASVPTTVDFSVMDWGEVTHDGHVGYTSLDISKLIDAAPKPDPKTGLYSEEAMRSHAFVDSTLAVSLDHGEKKWDPKSSPIITIRAKYDPHSAMRQRFWRSYLHSFDVDRSGQYSCSELMKALESIGLDVDEEKINDFFVAFGKNPEHDELLIEEAMQRLEEEFGGSSGKPTPNESLDTPVVSEPAVDNAQNHTDPLVNELDRAETPTKDIFSRVPLPPSPYPAPNFPTMVRSTLEDDLSTSTTPRPSTPSDSRHRTTSAVVTPGRRSVQSQGSPSYDGVPRSRARTLNPSSPPNHLPSISFPSRRTVSHPPSPNKQEAAWLTSPSSSIGGLDSLSASHSSYSSSSMTSSSQDPSRRSSFRRHWTPSTEFGSEHESDSTLVRSVGGSRFSEISSAERDQLEKLQKANEDLKAQLETKEMTLQKMASARDADKVDLEMQLEEVNDQLQASKQAEKELNAKEDAHSARLSEMESEVAKLQKSLEVTQTSHSGLQKQYDDLNTESGGYRSLIKQNDIDIKSVREELEAASTNATKWESAFQSAQETVASVTAELETAKEAQHQLDLQKQQNISLEETIERLRKNEKVLQQASSDHEVDVVNLRAQLEGIQHDLQATRQEAKELEAKEHDHAIQLPTLEAKISELQKSLAEAGTSYSDLQKQSDEQRAEFERNLNAIQEQNTKLKASGDLAERTAAEFAKTASDTIASMESDLEDKRSDLESMRGLKKDLELQIQENRSLEETIAGLRESEKTFNQTMVAHEASNVSLEAELAKVHAELEQKAKELEVTERNHTVQVATFETKISELEGSLQSGQASYEDLQKRHDEHHAESVRAHDMIRQKDIDLKTTGENLELVASEVVQWKLAHEEGQTTLESFKSALEVAQQDLEARNQANHLLEETIQKLQTSETTMQHTISAREFAIADLEADKARIQADLDACRHVFDELKATEHDRSILLSQRESKITELEEALAAGEASRVNLQQQFDAQRAETDERHLDVIRQNDIDLKSSLELVQTTASEVTQWKSAHESAQSTLHTAQSELEATRHHLAAEKLITRTHEGTIEKLKGSEQSLQQALSTRELDIANLEAHSAKVQDELVTSKREIAGLVVKENEQSAQLSVLESKISDLTTSLEKSEALSSDLQQSVNKQHDKLAMAHVILNQRDGELEVSEQLAQRTASEVIEWKAAHEATQQALASAESELALTRQLQPVLDARNEENRLLAEMVAKLQESETSLQKTNTRHEARVINLVEELAKTQEDLQASQHEVKTLHAQERDHSIRLTEVESEVLQLHESLVAAQESYSSLQKQHDMQYAESERDRELIKQKDMELKASQEIVETIRPEFAELKSVHETAQATITSTLSELETARAELQDLDRQRREVVLLEETVESLRLELDEARKIPEVIYERPIFEPLSDFTEVDADDTLSPSSIEEDDTPLPTPRTLSTSLPVETTSEFIPSTTDWGSALGHGSSMYHDRVGIYNNLTRTGGLGGLMGLFMPVSV